MGLLLPVAISTPSLTSTAPTGTSPRCHACCACSSASCMNAASLPGMASLSGIGDLGPAVRRFVQYQLVQVQAGTKTVLVGRLQDVKCDLGQVFDRGNA